MRTRRELGCLSPRGGMARPLRTSLRISDLKPPFHRHMLKERQVKQHSGAGAVWFKQDFRLLSNDEPAMSFPWRSRSPSRSSALSPLEGFEFAPLKRSSSRFPFFHKAVNLRRTLRKKCLCFTTLDATLVVAIEKAAYIAGNWRLIETHLIQATSSW